MHTASSCTASEPPGLFVTCTREPVLAELCTSCSGALAGLFATRTWCRRRDALRFTFWRCRLQHKLTPRLTRSGVYTVALSPRSPSLASSRMLLHRIVELEVTHLYPREEKEAFSIQSQTRLLGDLGRRTPPPQRATTSTGRSAAPTSPSPTSLVPMCLKTTVATAGREEKGPRENSLQVTKKKVIRQPISRVEGFRQPRMRAVGCFPDPPTRG